MTNNHDFSTLRDSIRSKLNLDRRAAILGKGDGTVFDDLVLNSGRVWVRLQTSNGLSTPILVRGPYSSTTPLTQDQPVWIGRDFDNQDYIISSDFSATVAAGGLPVGGPGSQAVTGNNYVIQSQIVTLRCSQSNPASMIVHVSGWKPNVAKKMYDYIGADIDLTSFIPATDTHCAVGIFVEDDYQTTTALASTPIPINDVLTVDDINNMQAGAGSAWTLAWVYDIRWDATAVLDSDTLDDARQIVNTAAASGTDIFARMASFLGF